MINLFKQLFKFGIVGILATIVDFGTLTLLTEVFGVFYLTSSCVAFILSTLFNYVASMKYVFKSRFTQDEKKQELLLFTVLSVIGLILNQLLMWFFVEKINVFYVLAKIFATILVMAWNFVSRKKWLE